MGNTSLKRLPQLDGLRGVAVILVVLNHLHLTSIITSLPPAIEPIISSFAASGKSAVGLLFLLSGYLMTTIYPVTHPFSFWQKRYTRIFPAFIGMCVGLVFVRPFWNQLPAWAITLIVTTPIVIGGMVWRGLQQSKHRQRLSSNLFKVFLAIQLVSAVVLAFGLNKVPPAVFFQLWPESLRWAITFLGNATMTLPVTTFLLQLDGVYWSVFTEVMLYLLYPIALLPMLHLVKTSQKNGQKSALLLSIFPFFYGIHLLSQLFQNFSMLHLYLAIYFVAGAVFGLFQTTQALTLLQRQINRLPPMGIIIICIFVLTGLPLVRPLLKLPDVIDVLLWSIPMTLVFLISSTQNAWSTLLRSKPLVIIGQYSYSLYLTHSLAIELSTKNLPSTTVLGTILQIAIAILWMVYFTVLLNRFLERPYFQSKSMHLKPALNKKQTVPQITFTPARIAPITATVLLGLVWLGFQTPVTPTSLVIPHKDPNLPPLTLLSHQPTVLKFSDNAPHLGMILLHIKPLQVKQAQLLGFIPGKADYANLVVTIMSDEKIHPHNSFPLYQLTDSRYHPIGLPLDSVNRNSEVTVTLALDNPEPMIPIALVNEGVALRSVHVYPKKEILEQPAVLAKLLLSRTTVPFSDPLAQRVLFLLLPVPLLLFLVTPEPKKTLTKLP